MTLPQLFGIFFLMWVVQFVLLAFTNMPGNAGSRWLVRQIRREPWKFLIPILATIFIEETIFRLIPSIIVDQFTNSVCWSVGVPVSVLFAYLHNRKAFSVSHLMGGLFLWYVMRTHGFATALAFHTLENTILLLPVLFWRQIVGCRWEARKELRRT